VTTDREQEPRPDRCVACLSGFLALREHASTASIARMWAGDPAIEATQAQLSAIIAGGGDRISIYQCAACGLEMAAPCATWTGDTYPAQGYYLAFDHAEALARLRHPSGLRLLELGCGDGLFLEAAAGLGHRVTGLDFARPAVERARGRGLDARLGDVAALRNDLPGAETFDVVALFQLLEHVADPDALFGDLAGVTHAGSRIFVGVPAPRRFSRAVGHAERIGSTDYWDWPPQHVLRWTPPALAAFLGRHGWEVESVRAEPFSLRGAAAYIAAVDGRRGGWYAQPAHRRLRTAAVAVRLAAARLRAPITGIRLFVAARRAG